MGEDRASPRSGRGDPRRVTVDEAARHLGLTVDAVRKRVQRDQIPHEKDAAGRVRIILDEGETLQDEGQTLQDDRTDLLIAEMQDRIRSLEEANRENRRIIAMLTSRIPEIEAPSEARESPESPGPGPSPPDASEGPHAAGERSQEPPRPWWRRVFGG